MSHMRSGMVRMTSHKCQWARNTSYYGLQVVHCVRRSHQYRISSKTTKYVLRVVACSSAVNMIYVRSSNEMVCVALLCHTTRVETSHSDSIQKTLFRWEIAINLTYSVLVLVYQRLSSLLYIPC